VELRVKDFRRSGETTFNRNGEVFNLKVKDNCKYAETHDIVI